MEPADPLPKKLILDDLKKNGELIILQHHSMLTLSDYDFSALRNPSQNFQFRGILWLTDHRLLYKGLFITEMGATKISENIMKPYCKIDLDRPFKIIIPIEDINDLFTGHDSTFQKRFQRYPKLRIQFKDNSGLRTFYFYLTRENLIDDEVYINKRCKEWIDKITEIKNNIIGVRSALSAKARPDITPSTAIIGTEGVLKEAISTIEGRRYGKIVVKPLEKRKKPGFTVLSTPIQKEEAVEESTYTKVLDTLVPVSDEEFSAATADTSIAKCPYCGWILGYATSKCPRCRKDI